MDLIRPSSIRILAGTIIFPVRTSKYPLAFINVDCALTPVWMKVKNSNNSIIFFIINFISVNGAQRVFIRFVRLGNRRFFGGSKSLVECLSVRNLV